MSWKSLKHGSEAEPGWRRPGLGQQVIAGAGYNGFPQEPSCRDERPPETNENCPPILDLLSLSAQGHRILSVAAYHPLSVNCFYIAP